VATPSDEELQQILADEHTTVGGYLVRKWGLPSRLHDPIVYHHDPARAAHAPRAAAVTYAADRLTHRFGFACTPDEGFDPLADPVFMQLGVDAATLARVEVEAPVLFEHTRTVGG
jgi:hypothetical protein